MAELIVFIITLPFTIPIFMAIIGVLGVIGTLLKTILDGIVSLLLPDKASEIFGTISKIAVIIIVVAIASQSLFMFSKSHPVSRWGTMPKGTHYEHKYD